MTSNAKMEGEENQSINKIEKKPFGVKFLTFGTGILSIIFLFTGIISVAFSSVIEGVLLITISILGFVFTRATWQLKRRAWIIHVFLQVINVVSIVVIIVTSMLSNTIINTNTGGQIVVAFLFLVNLYEGREYFT